MFHSQNVLYSRNPDTWGHEYESIAEFPAKNTELTEHAIQALFTAISEGKPSLICKSFSPIVNMNRLLKTSLGNPTTTPLAAPRTLKRAFSAQFHP